jgi:hypothetical protein
MFGTGSLERELAHPAVRDTVSQLPYMLKRNAPRQMILFPP